MEGEQGEEQEQDDDGVSVSETKRPSIPPIQLPPVMEEVPAVYCGVRLYTSEWDQHMYGIPPPGCFHARTIWLQAGLPVCAVARFLEIKLVDWTIMYAQLEMAGEEIRSVRYQAPAECLYFCSWRVFLRWMMCACLGSTGL